MSKQASLYVLEFKSGKIYVGITTKSVAERFAGHKKSAAKKGSNLPVHNAIKKHGDPRIIEVLRDDLDVVKEFEVALIAAWNCRIPFGYNVSFGGETSPSQTPEFKALMSSEINPMKRKEIRQARSGASHHMKTESQRARCRDQQLAKNNMHSEEARKKSSESHKGKLHSPSTKEKMSESQKKRFSDESSKAHWLSIVHSPEVREKRGAAISAGWARRRAQKLLES